MVVPEYPELAFERDIQGLVRLEADVGISGKVLDVRVLESGEWTANALSASRALLLWGSSPSSWEGGRGVPDRRAVRFRIEG
ncbi:MAG: TonB family protein [Candidatus Eisenbacteria bacterium]